MTSRYLGFLGTLGADYIDYLVADTEVVPPAHWQFYDEKMVYLPQSFFVCDHKQTYSEIVKEDILTRASFGLPDDKFVFAYFNQLYKISPEILDVWCSILKRVPNSLLWLIRFPAEGEENLLMECRKRGVKMEQVLFADVATKEDHLRRSRVADVFLDTSRCNAHSAAADVLWMGTPVITIRGTTMASRIGASLLKATGLEELICDDLTDYENLAVELAVDENRFIALRSKLEDNRESLPLFDTESWVKNLEKGYVAMWRRHESGSAPDHIQVVEDSTEGK